MINVYGQFALNWKTLMKIHHTWTKLENSMKIYHTWYDCMQYIPELVLLQDANYNNMRHSYLKPK